MNADVAGAGKAARRPLSLHWRILIGLIVGAVAGVAVNLWFGGQLSPGWQSATQNFIEPIGKLFLRLIFMVVVPLVFSALVLGIVAMGDVRRLGAIGLTTLGLTVLLSTISVVIALGAANLVRPGEQLSETQRLALREKYESDSQKRITQARGAKPLRDSLLDIVPSNPLQEMVGALDGSSPGGGMLAVMFFALCVGLAGLAAPQRTAPLIGVLEGVYDICMAIIGFAMRLAPLGVAAMLFALTAQLGFDVLRTVLGYVVTVVGGLSLHMFVVYPLFLVLLARRSPLEFFRRAQDALLTALATSSSNATLPTSLRVTEEKLGVRRDISGFVLTIGSTANQNGTALYEGVTVLFLAQAFGMDLTLTQQITVGLMCVLAGIGTAGVPGGSLPLVVLVLQSVGIPPESIALILGVDRILDMCRTTLNVAGDMTIAVCVDRLARRAPGGTAAGGAG